MNNDYDYIKTAIAEYMGCGCETCKEFWLDERKTTIEDMCYMTEKELEDMLDS